VCTAAMAARCLYPTVNSYGAHVAPFFWLISEGREKYISGYGKYVAFPQRVCRRFQAPPASGKDSGYRCLAARRVASSGGADLPKLWLIVTGGQIAATGVRQSTSSVRPTRSFGPGSQLARASSNHRPALLETSRGGPSRVIVPPMAWFSVLTRISHSRPYASTLIAPMKSLLDVCTVQPAARSSAAAADNARRANAPKIDSDLPANCPPIDLLDHVASDLALLGWSTFRRQ